MSLTMADLERLYYGGDNAVKLAYLQACAAAGVTAGDILNIAQGTLPPNSVGSSEMAQATGPVVLGRMSPTLGDIGLIAPVGMEIGYQEFVTVPGGLVLPTTVADVAGFTCVANVPAGVGLYIEAFLCGLSKTTAGNCNVFIYEGATLIAQNWKKMADGDTDSIEVKESFAATPGAHTYKIAFSQSAGACTIYGTGGLKPFLRVTTR